MATGGQKDALRARVSAARAAVTAETWAREDEARAGHLTGWLQDRAPRVVALYASVPGEPGTAGLIDALTASGARILLPVLRREVDWGWFTGWQELAPGWRGIPCPTGPRLGASALAEADLILVPCLAVTPDGARLGTGGGWYDRALPHRGPVARVVALARGDEVVETLPLEPHDVSVDGVVTEQGWVRL